MSQFVKLSASCSKNNNEIEEERCQFIDEMQAWLKPLDNLLRCHICFEYFSICMITKCSHNYCTLCIRKYMTYKAQCPICFQEAAVSELRNNRLLDDILTAYQQIRKNIIRFFDGNLDGFGDTGGAASWQISSVFSNKKTLVNDSDFANQFVNAVNCEKACSASVVPENVTSLEDLCLPSAITNSAPLTKEHKRKPLAKVVYHLLSDKEIRKRLKDHGLHTTGKRQDLIRRHKNFLILYNSECDSLNPRPVLDIVKQVQKEEINCKDGETIKLFQTTKKSHPTEIKQEHDQYVKHHAKEFGVLINEVQTRQQRKKETTCCSLTNQKSSTHVSSRTQKVELIDITSQANDSSSDASACFNPHSPDLFEDIQMDTEVGRQVLKE